VEVGEGAVEAVDEVEARADDALDRFLPPKDEGVVARTHHVTALVVSRDGAQWLPRTLAGLAGQERPADRVIGIDARSADGSGSLLSGGTEVVVQVEEPGLAGALASGVAAAATARATAAPGSVPPTRTLEGSGPEGPVDWLWIVHDDSAPDPGCLAALLRGADRNPGAAVLVPKTVAWSDPGRLVGVGSRWAPGTPVVDPLDPTERDQGQYDVDRPVYAGDSAGMLVRADVWRAVDGMDPTVGDWAGPADLCRRVWAIGSEVRFIPGAVLAHRQAGHRGVRPSPGLPHPRRSARAGQLILELSQAPALALPWRYVRAWLSTVVRVVALLLTREPEEATAEMAGAWRVLGHPGRIHRARRSLRRPPVRHLTRPEQVRAGRGAALSHSLDSWAAGSRTGPTRTWWPPPGRIWHPFAIAGALALAAFVREPGQLAGSGTLRGGGLLPAPGAMDLLDGYLASWHPARFGSPLAMPAYLPLLSAASAPFLGSVDLLLRLAFGLAVPLAFLSCYASLGPAWSGRHRIAMSLGYALLPAGVAAMGGGRISTLAVLLLAPPTARLISRALTQASTQASTGASGQASTGSPGIRPALAAGTMLGVVVAFAPSVYLVATLGAVLAWIGLRLARWPLRTALIILGVSGLFLVLWVLRVLHAPWLALSELGVNDQSLATPAPAIWGLAPGGPTSVAWAGFPLAAVALLAVAAARFSTRALVLLAAAVALLAAAAWLEPLAGLLWPDLGVGMLWPGVFVLLASALLALLVADVASSRGLAGELLSVAWVVCIGVLVVGWWVAPVSLAVGTGTGIPPVVGLDAQSAARPRSLVLDRLDGQLRYAVASGPQALLGDADAVAGAAVDPGFDDAVAGLVSGASGQVEQELGGRAIRFVVFDGPPEDPVVAELDATFGLRQLARAPEQSLWLVAGDPTRAELTDPTRQSKDNQPLAPLEVPVLTTPTTIDVELHPLTQLPRQLVVAEQSDPGWRGSLDGQPLDLVPDARGMSETTVDATGVLQVAHRSWWPVAAVAQLALFLVLLVLSLPKRRTVDPDAGVDPEPGLEGEGEGGGEGAGLREGRGVPA
jgi:GT2 family glycosyltransferase